MATTSFHEEEHGWVDFLRPLFDLFRRAGRRRAGDFKPIDIWADDSSVQEAILAVRMAANPGEDYEEVAERIVEEASRHREFLRNPTPIGKITLNAKQVRATATAGDVSGRVYQVRDPAEGQASVLYSFKRSAGLVLEFIVHDQDDTPLFPIVRTYSDWLGKRTFDLGAGRTFDLQMSEGECPEVVRVKASFNAANAGEAADSRVGLLAGGLPLAAGNGGDEGGRGNMNTVPPWSYGNRLALALCVECLVLVAFGWALWHLVPNRPLDEDVIARAVASHPSAFTTYAGGATQSRDHNPRLWVWDVQTLAGRLEVGYNTPTAEAFRKAQRKNDNQQQVTRIVAVTGGRIKIDDNFCRQVGDLCGKWRADLQSTLDVLNGLLKPPSRALAGLGQRPESMLSYLTEGTDHGHAHVTLLTTDALYLIRGASCIELDGGKVMSFTDTIPTLSETRLDICRPNDASEQRAEENNNATAGKRVKPLNSD